MSFDAVIIGGGINGLVAASVLARGGKKVCLLEQSGHLGGLAAPGPDGGARMAHLLYNLSPLVRREIGMDAHKWPFKLTPVSTVALNPDGPHVVIRGQKAQLADGSAHPEAEAYRQLNGQLIRYADILRGLAEGGPLGIEGRLSSISGLKELWRLGRIGRKLKRIDKSEMRRFLQMLLSNAYDLILDDLKDGPLAGMMAADAVRGGFAGPRSPGTVFSLIYRMGHGGEVTWPEGGMGAVVTAFEGAAQKAGVDIRLNAGVARILLAGDRVRAVETTGGDVIETKTVLSSTGALRTAHMAGVDAFDIEAARRLRNIRVKGTVAKINLTLTKPVSVAGLTDDMCPARLVLAPTAEYVERAFNPAKYRQMSEAPVIEALRIDAQTFSLMVQYAPVDLDGGWTDAAKDKLRAVTLSALAPYLPGLEDAVAQAEVITPDQIEAETGAPGGHWHHAEMALDQLLTLRPANGMGRYAMGPEGLYLCGAGAHPGGDLMGLAGRNAARAALEVGK
ncbi:phytoene desaturase family protein [Aestuariivita boseongensis]|uniref:phytoene desaturase family protein n=1 Tax=Aestuariivita boseongensis TaxID=1470562 RepID=UPI000681BAF8|nr:NAD(P)/FAD-dependent oxidoreductase [Aestuariivita boseongensis]